MKQITFPEDFPSEQDMKEILHKTIEKSWKLDIDISQVNSWLSNFNGQVYNEEDEKLIALWLLCNYTFYTSEDVNYLCKILFNKFIHDFVVDNSYRIEEIKERLKEVCFSSIGSASESGGLILYHFRQESELPLDKFSYPTNMNSNENSIVVFIDDAILSGGTGLRNFYNILEKIKYKKAYYLTIIASEDAVKKLEEKEITVIYCSLFDSRNKVFSKESMVFNKYKSLIKPAKEIVEHYGSLIIDKKRRPKLKPLGYDDGEFCFGFYYNTPNNTLPIFWSDLNWNPIFPRKEKLQNDKEYNFISGKFI